MILCSEKNQAFRENDAPPFLARTVAPVRAAYAPVVASYEERYAPISLAVFVSTAGPESSA